MLEKKGVSEKLGGGGSSVLSCALGEKGGEIKWEEVRKKREF